MAVGKLAEMIVGTRVRSGGGDEGADGGESGDGGGEGGDGGGDGYGT